MQIFGNFLGSIDWVAPKPSTFRINLKNNQFFYLIYNGRSWIAEIEGKSYYLLNLPEEEQSIQAISRILRYGSPQDLDGEGEESEEIDVTVDTDSEETEA